MTCLKNQSLLFLSGIVLAPLSLLAQGKVANCRDLKPDDFRKVDLVNKTNHPALSEPLQLDIAPDGRVFWVERVSGLVKVWNPTDK